MRDILEDLKGQERGPERRSYPRHQVRSLAYIELDEGNGGIVLNVSESGLTVQAVMPLMDVFLPQMRVQLSQSTASIPVAGQIVWTSDSKKVAGIRFIDLPSEAATQIRDWIVLEDFPLESTQAPNFPRETPETPEDTAATVATVAEQDSLGALTDSTVGSEEEIELVLVPENSRQKSANIVDANSVPGPAIRNSGASINNSGPRVASIPTFLRPPEPSRSHWFLYLIIAVLAVCSTLVGWSVGRTGLYGALAKLQVMGMSQDADTADPAAVPSASGATPKLAGIEVTDLGNRRWLVPFAATIQSAPASLHQQVVPRVSTTPQKVQPTGRVWTLPLSSSLPTRESRRPSSNIEEMAPTPPTQAFDDATGPLRAISGDTKNIVLPAPSGVNQPASDTVQPAQLLHRVQPVYPQNALQSYSDATIKLHIAIDADGQVQNVTLVSGPPIFFPVAQTAIRQWRYRPALVNGKPSASGAELSMVFRHPQ
jgi:hypothetical protein